MATSTLPSKAATAEGHPVALGLSSGLLLWLAFPPVGWAWLAWLALMPLFLLVPSERSRWSIYLGAWVGGLTFWLPAIQWVRLTEPSTAWLAWLVMATFLSLGWPAFVLLARLATRRFGLPLMLGAPIAWVALEFARAFILTGFPWYYLAHSQYRYAHLIQIADFSGALGLSFLMAMANACWVELLQRPLFHEEPHGARRPAWPQVARVALLAVGLAATLGYGAYRINTARFRQGPRLALVQSNIKQEYKNSLDPRDIVALYRGLVDRALRANERPDLIVWPETSFPYGVGEIDVKLTTADLTEQVRHLTPDRDVAFWRTKLQGTTGLLQDWTDRSGVPMLIGSLYYHFRPGGLGKFNSAVLFEPGQRTVQFYHKLHLVPFGEYVPLIKTLPWLVALTPYRGTDYIPGLTFGGEPRWFDLDGVRIAVPICFEDTVPHVVRRFFTEAPGGHQPDLLINISNDGWFQWSEELDMHLAVSVFRCVENRVPLARAVNTGISALIDGNGQIRASLPKKTEGILEGITWLDDRISLYTFWGDWLGQLCLGLAIGLVPLSLAHAAYRRWRSGRDSTSLPSLPNSL